MTIENEGAVMVLGASRGLGQAIALVLSQAGFPVGAACRRMSDAREVSETIAARGGRALPLQVEVTSFESVGRAVAELSDWAGGISGLVNNAGVIEPIAHVGDTDPAAWRRLIEVNIVGAYHGMRAVLPYLDAGGVVVNISSGAASRFMEGWSAYCASKAALAMLTQSVHHEYGGRGIVSYGFRPGVVDTGMQGKIRESGINPVSQIPRETLLKPEVPAKGVLWLLRNRPADLSGAEIDIRDGGFLERMAV